MQRRAPNYSPKSIHKDFVRIAWDQFKPLETIDSHSCSQKNHLDSSADGAESSELTVMPANFKEIIGFQTPAPSKFENKTTHKPKDYILQSMSNTNKESEESKSYVPSEQSSPQREVLEISDYEGWVE